MITLGFLFATPLAAVFSNTLTQGTGLLQGISAFSTTFRGEKSGSRPG